MIATRAARRRAAAFAGLMLVSLLLLVLSDTGPMQSLREGLGAALTPVQAALTSVTRGITSVAGAVFSKSRRDKSLRPRVT